MEVWLIRDYGSDYILDFFGTKEEAERYLEEWSEKDIYVDSKWIETPFCSHGCRCRK